MTRKRKVHLVPDVRQKCQVMILPVASLEILMCCNYDRSVICSIFYEMVKKCLTS